MSLQDKEHHKAIQTIALTAHHLLRLEIFQNSLMANQSLPFKTFLNRLLNSIS